MFIVVITCILLNFVYPSFGLAQEQVEPALHFILAEWAHEVRDEGDYEPNPTGAFPRGERAYAYFEVVGFGLSEQDGFFQALLNVDVGLKSKGGLRLFSRKDVLELESWYIEPPETLWFYIYVDIPWWAPRGEYLAEITVRDLVDDEKLLEERKIQVF